MVVKVSKEVYEALENYKSWLKVFGVSDKFKGEALNHNINKGFSEEREILNNIDSLKFAEILINGYEIEETPEENLLKFYNKCDWFSEDGTECQTIRITLDKLNIKIKGIND